MNSDDFEKRLERQMIRPIPGEWRREILQCAKDNSVVARAGFLSILNQKLSTLLWPCPQAWAGLTAVWIIIFALNFTTQETTPKFAKSEPPSRDFIFAMKEQRRLYLELIGTPSDQVAEPPKTFVPRPQSKRETRFELV